MADAAPSTAVAPPLPLTQPTTTTKTAREGWRAPLSRGDSTVSARDSTYWLAVASASSSVSARSLTSSSASPSSSPSPSPSAHALKLPSAAGSELRASSPPKRTLQLATSPLRCAAGGDVVVNPLQLALQAAAAAATDAGAIAADEGGDGGYDLGESPASFERRRASGAKVALEEVFENQRYQLVLGWGSKGHLLPLDPGKFMRAIRRPRRGGLDRALLGRKSRRRRSLGDFSAHPLAERYSDPGSCADGGDDDDADDDADFDTEWVHSPTFPDVSLPTCADGVSRWEWISPWYLEFPSGRDANRTGELAAAPADSDGWQYATSFQHFALSRKSTDAAGESDPQMQEQQSRRRSLSSPLVASAWRPKHYVRCRKWVRYRRCRPPALAVVEAETGGSSAFDDSFLDSMCGWLRKLGHVRKNWKARYFVLERSVLRYYTDESMARLKGEVLLFHPAARVHYVDIHLSSGRDCAFAIHVGKNYSLLLQAEQLSERESWMYCIEDALLCRDSYYQDDGGGGGESPEQLARRNVRESVALRRKLSSESMVFNTVAARGNDRAGINLVALVDSKTLLRRAVQEKSLVMRLLAECDAFLESPQVKQLALSFLHKFKSKYSVTSPAAAATNADGSGRRRSRGASCADTQQPPPVPHPTPGAAALDDTPSVMVLQDGRSLLALKNYRFFLERSLSTVLSHLAQLPLVTGSPITSPRGWKPAAARGGSKQPHPANKTEELVSDDEWQLVRKAALYKLERLTFIPLQDVLYSLLESTVCPEDLEDFERNRQHLGAQSQAFFEIPASHASRSQWKSATALLNTVDNYSLPCEKSAVLLEVARCIYETHASEQAQQATPQMMAADDFLPIFIFILARSSLRNIVVARHLISETMVSALMLGETGYYATMLEAAVGYIASFDIATATAMSTTQPAAATPAPTTPMAMASPTAPVSM